MQSTPFAVAKAVEHSSNSSCSLERGKLVSWQYLLANKFILGEKVHLPRERARARAAVTRGRAR